VIVVLDASTLINLANGEVFAKVISLPARSFRVSAAVKNESRTVARAIAVAVKCGDIEWVDDTAIDLHDFQAALDTWGLGAGETECILAAKLLGCSVACDDGEARKIIQRELGVAKLTGSMGLLREAVAAGLLTSEEAFSSYELMRARGGYLPKLAAGDF
jgi:predicted nucleic acid-binding protein